MTKVCIPVSDRNGSKCSQPTFRLCNDFYHKSCYAGLKAPPFGGNPTPKYCDLCNSLKNCELPLIEPPLTSALNLSTVLYPDLVSAFLDLPQKQSSDLVILHQPLLTDFSNQVCNILGAESPTYETCVGCYQSFVQQDRLFQLKNPSKDRFNRMYDGLLNLLKVSWSLYQNDDNT